MSKQEDRGMMIILRGGGWSDMVAKGYGLMYETEAGRAVSPIVSIPIRNYKTMQTLLELDMYLQTGDQENIDRAFDDVWNRKFTLSNVPLISTPAERRFESATEGMSKIANIDGQILAAKTFVGVKLMVIDAPMIRGKIKIQVAGGGGMPNMVTKKGGYSVTLFEELEYALENDRQEYDIVNYLRDTFLFADQQHMAFAKIYLFSRLVLGGGGGEKKKVYEEVYVKVNKKGVECYYVEAEMMRLRIIKVAENMVQSETKPNIMINERFKISQAIVAAKWNLFRYPAPTKYLINLYDEFHGFLPPDLECCYWLENKNLLKFLRSSFLSNTPPLINAMQRNNRSIFLDLLEVYDKTRLNRIDPVFGFNVLQECCKSKYDKSYLLDLLDKRGEDVNLNLKCKGTDKTGLHIVCENMDLERAIILVEHGANVDPRDNAGDTPLYLALASLAKIRDYDKEQTKIARLLLELKANPNARNKRGENSVWIVVNKGGGDFTPFLLDMLSEYGADYDQKNVDGSPILHLSMGSNRDIVKKLLDHCSLDAIDKNGQTALHQAVIQGKSQIVKMLLEYEADREIVDKSGKRAADYATDKSINL
jgi:ankyrin repeat protein